MVIKRTGVLMDAEGKYYRSTKIMEGFKEAVKKDTWDKGLPMVYKNENGDYVRHFPDGKIEIIGRLKKYTFKERVSQILAIIVFSFLSLWIVYALWISFTSN